jgi:hypothetical protein
MDPEDFGGEGIDQAEIMLLRPVLARSIFHWCRRRFKTGFLAGSKPDSLLETESA